VLHIVGMSNKKIRTHSTKTKRQIEQQDPELEQQQPYQYRIGFDQSVSSGVIAVKGEVLFNPIGGHLAVDGLVHYLQAFEEYLDSKGYMVASKHAPKKTNNGITV